MLDFGFLGTRGGITLGGRVDDEGDETNIRRSNNTNNSHTRSTGPRDKNLHSFNTYQFSAVKYRYTTKNGGRRDLQPPSQHFSPPPRLKHIAGV